MDKNLVKKCLSTFSTGITVVTAKNNNDFFGITINSFTSLSLEPYLILFNLHIHSSKLPYFFTHSTFIVNILSAKQKNLSNIFCKTQEKFPTKDYFLYQDLPVLKDSLSFLLCKTKTIYKEGDHRIIVAYNLHCEELLSNEEALLYFKSQYCNVSNIGDKKINN